MNLSQTVLDFWFSEKMRPQWFASNPALDQLIQEKFLSLHQQAILGELKSWENNPQSLLALVILLDQFSRNMFRDTPQAFANDAKSLALTQKALTEKMDHELSAEQRMFLYMPLMHSEDLKNQELSLQLFSAFEYAKPYAQQHFDIIKRFGRFPTRNKILNRDSTEDELNFLKENSATIIPEHRSN